MDREQPPGRSEAGGSEAGGSEAGGPEADGLYRAIMMVLVGSVMVGALLTLTGEMLFDSRPLANVGLGMAVLAGIAYWGLRLKARAAARRMARSGESRAGESKSGESGERPPPE